MAIRKKKKINPKYRVKKLYKIRIIILTVLLILLFTNVNYYTGIPVKGNISNLGIVAEYDNDIYYIKYNDGVYRSKLTIDKKIIDGQVYSMQIKDSYLYYMKYNNNSACIERVNRYGTCNYESLASFNTSMNKFYLDDNYIYYTKDGENAGLYRTNIDELKEEQLISGKCDDFQLESGKIYYLMSNYIGVMNNDATEKDILGSDEISEFIVYKGWIYYTNNMNGNLMRINILGNQKNVIVHNFFIMDYNIFDDKIYYYNNEAKKICTVSIAGNDYKEIVEVNNKDTMINITSNGDIYYLEYYQDGDFYEYTRINKDGKSKNISMNWRVI